MGAQPSFAGFSENQHLFAPACGPVGRSKPSETAGSVSPIAALIFAAYTVARNSLPSWQSAFDSRRPLQINRGLVERFYGAFIPRRTRFDPSIRNQHGG